MCNVIFKKQNDYSIGRVERGKCNYYDQKYHVER